MEKTNSLHINPEEAKTVELKCIIKPTSDGKYMLKCCKFPDVYVKFTPPLTRAKIEEFEYNLKCAFLDKGIILRTDVDIKLNIEYDV